jgi:hypothetical protein
VERAQKWSSGPEVEAIEGIEPDLFVEGFLFSLEAKVHLLSSGLFNQTV